MKRDSKQVLTELLVIKAQGGDERAFTELYELWAKDFLRMAKVDISPTIYAEEVAQDTWVTIAKGLSRVKDPACFPSWAFRILNRRCVDWIRRKQADRRRMDGLEREEDSASKVRSSTGDATVADLGEAIERLEPGARKLLHLFYNTGMSIAEVAVALDLPAGTVKSRLFKTREQLKQYLERMKNE